jgi:hypothetical protein
MRDPSRRTIALHQKELPIPQLYHTPGLVSNKSTRNTNQIQGQPGNPVHTYTKPPKTNAAITLNLDDGSGATRQTLSPIPTPRFPFPFLSAPSALIRQSHS